MTFVELQLKSVTGLAKKLISIKAPHPSFAIDIVYPKLPCTVCLKK